MALLGASKLSWSRGTARWTSTRLPNDVADAHLVLRSLTSLSRRACLVSCASMLLTLSEHHAVVLRKTLKPSKTVKVALHEM